MFSHSDELSEQSFIISIPELELKTMLLSVFLGRKINKKIRS